MIDSNWPVVRADLRLQLRRVDTELQRIEQEYEQFQKLGFSSDVLDINARAHLDHRQEIIGQLKTIEQNDLRLQVRGQPGLLGWLLLPAVLCMIGWRSLTSRLA